MSGTGPSEPRLDRLQPARARFPPSPSPLSASTPVREQKSRRTKLFPPSNSQPPRGNRKGPGP